MDPRSPAARRAIEVYPHAATVVLFRLPRTLKYKAKPGRSLDQLKSELLLLMDGVEGLAHAPVPLQVAGPDWVGLRRQVLAAQRKSDLRRAEDPIDAVVCAYVALYAVRCPDGVTIYGDVATGCIVTPTLPSGPYSGDQIRTGRWSIGASTSIRSTTVANAAVSGSRPSTSAETTEPSTAQISVHTSSMCTDRPDFSMASATASARCRRLRRIVSRNAGKRVQAMWRSYLDISCSASPEPDTSPTSKSTSISAVVSGPLRRRDSAVTRARSWAISIIPMCSTARAIKSSSDEK